MACRITTEQILEILDEELDVGLNMECGEDEESDSDVDNTFLEERIWNDLEYNEDIVLQNSFGECSGYDTSSNEAGEVENDTGNSYEQSCVRGCGKRGTIRTRAGHGCGRGRGTDGRGHSILRGSGTDQQSSSDTTRKDVDPRRRGATSEHGFRGRGRRQSTTQEMNLDWTVISSG